MIIIKKDGTEQPFDISKVIKAVSKSAERCMHKFTDEEISIISNTVTSMAVKYAHEHDGKIPIKAMHHFAETALDSISEDIAKAYRDYRNYKVDFCDMLDSIYRKSQSIRYIGDVSNANTDSAMVSTQRSLIYGQLNKNLYQKFFLNKKELQAANEGFIYIHDMKDRLDSINCFRRDTRFITKDGIKSFYDYYDGDITYVITHTGEWKRAVVHKYGWQPIQKVTFAKGTYTSNKFDVYVTPNHRWILKDGSVTTNLQVGDHIWQIPDATLFDWNSLSLEDRKLWCKGFAKGDGCLNGSLNHIERQPHVTIRLCGEKIKYIDRFRSCGYSVKPMKGKNDFIVYMLDTMSKDIPFYSLNFMNMKYYINGFMCANGGRNKYNSNSEFKSVQVTGDFNRYIYDMLNMSGYFVTNITNLTNQVTNYGRRTDITFNYGLSSSQYGISCWRVINIEPAKLNPKAEVWCLEVEDNHSFVLEGGIATGNCCLFDISNVLKGGFEMGNQWYTEPKTLDVAFDVISDITMSAASQQYGGFTLPRIDTVLEPYAEKSYKMYYDEYKRIVKDASSDVELSLNEDMIDKRADEYAEQKVRREFEQGFQSWEYKFNTVGSSRGDYPFIACSFGINTSRWGTMATSTCLSVRKGGQGKPGHKKAVLFPKLNFLYDEELHGIGKPYEYLFNEGINCSAKAMYPDFLSLTGEGYIPSIYKKYGKVISLMGKVFIAHL